MSAASLSRLLLAWYRRHGRVLPWRNHPDPYAVWVSEIMLQQTRVEAALPYFEKWMRLFPTTQALANADEREVLSAWEGLGYYSRARNLHKAAKIVCEQFNGELPRNLDDLRRLPGIGRYTVGAIASMAFGMDEPTLDGNLRRVFSRLFDVTEPADSPAGEKILWELAAQNLPKGKAGDYNQALMDLGATLCLPKNPRCLLCPLSALCLARQRGTQAARPLLKPKKKTPHVLQAAAVILRRGRVLLAQRSSDGLLGGMWQFPAAQVESDSPEEARRALAAAYGLDVKIQKKLGVIRHAYTHFTVDEYVFACELLSPPKDSPLRWARVNDLQTYPMGKIDRQIAKLHV
ncbi:MAG: A/G-specific adenine glycosylase [Anaerolineales bacterium]